MEHPQDLINDLTDTVSALRARLSSVEAESRNILRTAQGEMDRARRAEAERDALAERLQHMIWTHDDSAGAEEAQREVQEIMIEARNDLPEPFSFEERRMAEWLNAIRLEIEARGTHAKIETVLHYAQEALSGKTPHWMTNDYLTRARDPRQSRRA